ncbi:DUF3987 domain-containing protein [Rhodanobacter sp. DHG33]|uniref:DUF3987 domain-containing protein n=1 Tax=Rhodanobacter sp. DHG33 TaxID=2775921 RepID=UPI0017838C9C|nr:DUF3987 domain-containing protein [Rhodanobacter sp. DHG33]MBD8898477.1 DUF3987 domain-containing protein [Rhodanobacter sp. DHG33]
MIDYVTSGPGNTIHIDWSSTLQSHLPSLWFDALLESPAQAGIPLALCFASQLGAVASAVAQHASVKHPISGEETPLSLYIMGIAESGVGKTPAYNAFAKPIMEVFARQESQNGATSDQFKSKYRLWELKRKGLDKAIVKAAQACESDDHLKEAMREHENNMPTDDRVLYQAMSFSAFAKAVCTNHKRIIIASDEAHPILKSGVMTQPAVLSNAWQGGTQTFMLDGAHTTCSLNDLVLTFVLFVQPKFSDQFLAKNDGAARESGLMARTLIVRCSPHQNNDLTDDEVTDQGHLHAFLARLEQLVIEAFRHRRMGEYSRTTLTFSPDAVVLWKKEHDTINAQARPGGNLENISDFVAKYMDNASRIAGIFHVAEGLEGEISSTTLSRAIAVMRLFLAEFKRMFDPTDDTPKSIKDAWRVTRYLYEYNWVPGFLPASYNDVLQGRAVREGGPDFEAAISVLINNGYVTVDKSERKQFIRLNPTAFSKLTTKSLAGPIPEAFYRAPIPLYGNPNCQGPLPLMGGLFSSQAPHQRGENHR